MSLTRLSNIRHSELIERMALFVDMDAAVPCVFRCVLTKYNNDWSLLMGVLTLSEADFDSEQQACWYRYPNFQFICCPLENITLSELMIGLNNDGCLPIPNLPRLDSTEGDINWTESLIPSHASSGSFPERSFSGRLSSNVSSHDSKLVAHGMPFHPSAFKYVREFLELDRFHGSSDARKGELLIKVSDRRGYLTLTDQTIQFHSDTIDTLSLVGAIDNEPVQLQSQQDTYEFEPDKASDVELWLVTDCDEIIDYRSSTEWEYRYETKQGNTDLDKLLQIIKDGESEHCEFKKYIDLVDKQNKKAWDIDKAVCAFSNHKGGRLFIGVDDETRIVGIDEGCQRHYKCDPIKGAEHYVKAVAKRLQESLTQNQCFKVYLMKHFELFMLVVDVDKANDLNFLIQTDVAYIRRGASSRQITPTEIQAFPAGRERFI